MGAVCSADLLVPIILLPADLAKAVEWALHYLKIMVQQTWLKPAAVTGDSLADNKSAKAMTLGQVLFYKRGFLEHVRGSIPHLVMGLGSETDKIKAELEMVLEKVYDLREFEKLLPRPVCVENAGTDGSGNDLSAEGAIVQQNDADVAPESNPLDDFAESLTAPAKAMLKLLHSLLSADLESEFQQVFLQADDAKKAMQASLIPSEGSDSWAIAVSKFIQEMELVQASAEEASAGGTKSQAPAPKVRELVRTASDEGDFEGALAKRKAERDKLWANCVAHRAKYLRLMACKGKTSDEIVQMITFLSGALAEVP